MVTETAQALELGHLLQEMDKHHIQEVVQVRTQAEARVLKPGLASVEYFSMLPRRQVVLVDQSDPGPSIWQVLMLDHWRL